MRTAVVKWALAALLFAFWSAAAAAQDARWDEEMSAARLTHQRGQPDRAERHLIAALAIAEDFDPEDPEAIRSSHFRGSA